MAGMRKEYNPDRAGRRKRMPIIYIICFKYKPMISIVMAFKKYTPFGGRSMWEMDWVGLQWFEEAFRDSLFWKSLANTLILNMGDVVFNVQSQMLDAIFTGILPLGITMLTLFLLKNKKMKATTVMGILILIGIVGGVTGILAY